jgi:hypothetical protein
MKSNMETRLRRLEASVGQGDGSILVIEKLEDAKTSESFQRGLIKTVIATGVPRGPPKRLFGEGSHAREFQVESHHLEARRESKFANEHATKVKELMWGAALKNSHFRRKCLRP